MEVSEERSRGVGRVLWGFEDWPVLLGTAMPVLRGASKGVTGVLQGDRTAEPGRLAAAACDGDLGRHTDRCQRRRGHVERRWSKPRGDDGR